MQLINFVQFSRTERKNSFLRMSQTASNGLERLYFIAYGNAFVPMIRRLEVPRILVDVFMTPYQQRIKRMRPLNSPSIVMNRILHKLSGIPFDFQGSLMNCLNLPISCDYVRPRFLIARSGWSFISLLNCWPKPGEWMV